jgi:hypothetical protein
LTQVFDPARGGTTPGDAVAGPEDFAQWLTDHPHLKTTKPAPVEALGLKGVSIEPDGKQLVVEQFVEPASALKAQAPAFEALLESATTASGGRSP